jgi:hypothetical protein
MFFSPNESRNTFFLYSPFPEISPQCNIPNGNQRNEPLALVYFSYLNPSEGTHLGKIFTDKVFIGTLFIRSEFHFPALLQSIQDLGGVNIAFPCHVRAEGVSLISFIPPQKSLVPLLSGRRNKAPISCDILLDILLPSLYSRLIPKEAVIT